MSHSPLPWAVQVNRMDAQQFQLVNIVSLPQQGYMTGEVVAAICDTRVNSEKCEGNANLIVRAVNHHDKLIAALTWLLDDMTDAGEDANPETGTTYDSVAHAREALAAAKGEA